MVKLDTLYISRLSTLQNIRIEILHFSSKTACKITENTAFLQVISNSSIYRNLHYTISYYNAEVEEHDVR